MHVCAGTGVSSCVSVGRGTLLFVLGLCEGQCETTGSGGAVVRVRLLPQCHSSGTFPVDGWGFPSKNPATCRWSFICSFLNCTPLNFVLFYSLMSPAGLPVWGGQEWWPGCPCLVPDLRGVAPSLSRFGVPLAVSHAFLLVPYSKMLPSAS